MADAKKTQAAQSALIDQLLGEIAALFKDFDVHDLDREVPWLTQQVHALVTSFGAVAGQLSREQYNAARKAAKAKGVFTPKRVKPPTRAVIDKSVRWATKDLWGPEPDLDAAKALVQDIAEKHVLDVGRRTILEATQDDPADVRWARIPEPGACYFCLLLATRGAVYHSKTADFESHDHCRCHAEPIFGVYTPSPEIAKAEEVYTSSTRGKSGDKAIAAFRSAWDDRAA